MNMTHKLNHKTKFKKLSIKNKNVCIDCVSKQEMVLPKLNLQIAEP